jgi:hypothetical protein
MREERFDGTVTQAIRLWIEFFFGGLVPQPVAQQAAVRARRVSRRVVPAPVVARRLRRRPRS